MPIQEQDQMCDNLVRKMTAGYLLDADEKSHLARCEDCMSQIIRKLDEAAMDKTQGLGSPVNGTNGDGRHAGPEANKALEHGRQVFEREFRLSLPRR